MSSELSRENIRRGLGTSFIGQHILYYPSIDSTNLRAIQEARAGAPEGTLVIAEAQTAGRGRLGRRWYAPAGSSLLFSLILYPPLKPQEAAQLTMLTGLAVAEAIESLTGLAVSLKWPNDILIRGRKVGGILTEASSTSEKLDYVVVGIGLNVNFRASELPEMATPATTLFDELGCEVSRLQLLQAILARLEARYLRLRSGERFQAEWAGKLETIGQYVEVAGADGIQRGWARGVSEDGALIVEREDGQIAQLSAGEVRTAALPPAGEPQNRAHNS